MTLKIIKNYLENNILDITIPYCLKKLKNDFVKRNNQEKAKEIWCYETIYFIKVFYIEAFRLMKTKKFPEAWEKLDYADIKINFLIKHFDLRKNKYDLLFISESIKKFQKLFPYKAFMSRENIIKEEHCSICNEIISIRNNCGHTLGEIYDGEYCYSKVKDSELLGLILVEHPEDKNSYVRYLEEDSREYNYKMLELLIEHLKNPFECWELKVHKIKEDRFKKLGRNEVCLCGSGLKYKKCCFETGKDSYDYLETILLENPGNINVPYQKIPTLKNKILH